MFLLRIRNIFTPAVRIVKRNMATSQLTDRVMMVRPSCFYSNPETAADNSFQSSIQPAITPEQVQKQALIEFDAMVEKLRLEGVHVSIVEDTIKTPDAIFPNNWISFHSPIKKKSYPTIVLYPMKSELRRNERREDIVQQYTDILGSEVKDYTSYEAKGMYLEGTGSMVLDRVNNTVFACLSQRTNINLLKQFCKDFGSKLVFFESHSVLPDGSLSPIYHTNVMMSIGTTFAVVCLESITDKAQRDTVQRTLKGLGKEVVPLTLQQVSSFAGNVLQLRGSDGHAILVMSTRAYKSLTPEQLQVFTKHSCSVLHFDVSTIETYGGGGVRCMIAEVFPPLKSHD